MVVKTLNMGKIFKKLDRVLKFCNITIIIMSVFNENGKFYSQLFLDDALYKLYNVKYQKSDISEGIDINETNASKRM